MSILVKRWGVPPHSALPSASKVSRIVIKTFQIEKERLPGDISIIFVDSKRIRALNKKFLNTTGDTDVIAFPYESFVKREKQEVFGDVYISVPEARKNALRFSEPFEREMIRLIVHGVLHLLGYSDHAPGPRKKMWARQEKITQSLSRK